MRDAERSRARRRYIPLVYRVAGLNAMLLAAAVVVTLLVLLPRRLSSVAVDEASVLALSLALVGILNFVVLHRVIGPIVALTRLAREVDLAHPELRMPNAAAVSEAGELSLTFNEMLDRLEAERREVTGRVLAGQEAERLRIAQELHDQIGQELTAVLLGLSRLHALTPPERQDIVENVQKAVRSSLDDVRRIALELRPEALDELGLVSALIVLGRRLRERAGMTVEHVIDENLPDLEPDVELVVYRVAQEALTNVARHSGTKHATLTLHAAAEGLTMEIVDQGRGMAADARPGTGMRGMQERATLIGGRLDVTPGPNGAGCRVRLHVEPSRTMAGTDRVLAADGAATNPDSPGG